MLGKVLFAVVICLLQFHVNEARYTNPSSSWSDYGTKNSKQVSTSYDPEDSDYYSDDEYYEDDEDDVLVPSTSAPKKTDVTTVSQKITTTARPTTTEEISTTQKPSYDFPKHEYKSKKKAKSLEDAFQQDILIVIMVAVAFILCFALSLVLCCSDAGATTTNKVVVNL